MSIGMVSSLRVNRNVCYYRHKEIEINKKK